MFKAHIQGMFGQDEVKFGVIEAHCGKISPPFLTAKTGMTLLDLGAAGRIWGYKESRSLIAKFNEALAAEEKDLGEKLTNLSARPDTNSTFGFQPTQESCGQIGGVIVNRQSGVELSGPMCLLGTAYVCLHAYIKNRFMQPADAMQVVKEMVAAGAKDMFTDEYLSMIITEGGKDPSSQEFRLLALMALFEAEQLTMFLSR